MHKSANLRALAPILGLSAIMLAPAPLKADDAADALLLKRCMEIARDARGAYPAWASGAKERNEGRAKERERLGNGIVLLVSGINEYYQMTTEHRARFLERGANRIELAKAFQLEANRLADTLSSVEGIRVVFTPDKIEGRPFESPAFFISYAMRDPNYDRDTYYRDPELPKPPKGAWQRFWHAVDLDAVDSPDSHLVYFDLGVSSYVSKENAATISHGANWTPVEILALDHGFDYLREERILSQQDFIADKVGFDCLRHLGSGLSY
jgi:hypothetical protein